MWGIKSVALGVEEPMEAPSFQEALLILRAVWNTKLHD